MNNILHKPKPFAWSFSALNNFETCPRQYHEMDVLKNFKKPMSPELQDGFAVHKALADRITKGVTLPSNMPFEKWAKYALDAPGRVSAEQKLAITEDIKSCDYWDKIRHPWFRTVVDVLRVQNDFAHVIDWKTGKIKPDPTQLLLIATCVMAHYPYVHRVKAEYVWLAHDAPSTEKTYTVDDLEEFWADEMLARVSRFKVAHQTRDFPPKRSGLCRRWCEVVTCEHCGQ